MFHLVISIYGQVQGVSFRYYTQAKAQELGVKGFVRNEAYNMVYIEAEGKENDLKALLKWCQKGPKWAKVEKVEHKFSKKLKGYKRFIINV